MQFYHYFVLHVVSTSLSTTHFFAVRESFDILEARSAILAEIHYFFLLPIDIDYLLNFAQIHQGMV